MLLAMLLRSNENVRRFYEYIGTKRGRRALLFIDNASCHGSKETIPLLRNVRIQFLPKRTTSLLQPFELGIIAWLKRRYQLKLFQRAIELIENGYFNNIFCVDLKLAISCVYEI